MANRKSQNLLFVNYYGTGEGGAPLSTSFLIRSLKENNYNVSIVSKNRYQGTETHTIKDVRKIPFFFLRDFYLKRNIKKIIKKRNIDILHCADGRFSVVASISAARDCGIPVVLHFRDYWFNCLKGDLVDRKRQLCSGLETWKCLRCGGLKKVFWELYKIQYFKRRKKQIKQADSIICVSSFVKDQLEVAGIRKNVNVVYNPLPETLGGDYRNKSDKKTVLFIGSLFKHKGIYVFLEVAKILAARKANVNFLIAGSGDEYQTCKKFIFDNNLDNVELTGYLEREKIPDIYRRSDIVFLPSLCFDTFSRSVIESLRFSKAVVAANMGGNKEIIRDGTNGFLVNPYNLKMCADLIQKLVVDNNLRERISENAYQRSLDFSINKISKKVINIYKDIASKKNAGN